MTRILPADVYDGLELLAEVYGGVGAGAYAVSATPYDPSPSIALERGEPGAAPVCAIGFGIALDGWGGEAFAVLRAADIGETTSDRAVVAINRRHRRVNLRARVPFAAWAAELGVERGS